MKHRALSFLALAAALAAVFALVLSLNDPAPGRSGSPMTQRIADFARELDDIGRVDESLILFRELAPFDLRELPELTALAVGQDDRVYAGGATAVVVLDAEGTRLARFELDAAIGCLAVGEDGTLYAGHGARVHAYDSNGARAAVFEAPRADARIVSIVALGDTVFAANASGRVIYGFRTNESAVMTIDGRFEANEPGFVVPSPYFDLAPAQGLMFWAVNPGLHRLEEYTVDGVRVFAWPSAQGTEIDRFVGCCNPCHIARFPDGSIVTVERGIARIKHYSRRGVFLGVVATPDCFDGPNVGLDVAVDSKGRVLAADALRRQVRRWERR